jgi:hypothetical protein
MFNFGTFVSSKKKHTQCIKKLIQLREKVEQREEFLLHKLKDVKNKVHMCGKKNKQKLTVLVTRCQTLQSMANSAFQVRITIDGYIDSLVTMGVLHETEHLIAASITLSAAETLMSSISNAMVDVNEICSVLSEDICETNELDLLDMLKEVTQEDIELEEIPLPPTDIPQQPKIYTNNDRGNKIANR